MPLFQKKDSIMVCGGILAATGKKVLVLWARNVWGTIRTQTYVDYILVPFIWPFWYWESIATGRTLLLMEDEAPAHHAHHTQAYKEQFHIPTITWPPSSPHLNPIDNIWSVLKTKLNAHNPRPEGKQQMKQAILEEWNAITVEDIQKNVDCMPEHIRAVLEAEGGHTRW
jgi:hypothetical protein